MCSIHHTTKFLGEGQSARVYAAINSNKKSVAVKISLKDIRFTKQPCEIEYEIMSRLNKVVPGSVPKVYGASWCRNFKPRIFTATAERPDVTQQYVIKMEYFPMGDLRKFLDRMHNQRRLSDGILQSTILDVISSLKTIKSSVPSFRHNDLHLGNILVGERNKMILYDFNLSSMSGVDNPMLNDERLKIQYGIAKGNSDKYDSHFFLNCMLDWIGKHRRETYRETFDFLQRVMPKEYRGAKTPRVSMYRLIMGVNVTDFPTLDQILADEYFTMELPTPIPMAILEQRPIRYLQFPKTVKPPAEKANTYRLPPTAYNSAQFKSLVQLMTEAAPTNAEWARMRNTTTLTRNQYEQTLKNSGWSNAQRALINSYKAQGIPSYQPPTKIWTPSEQKASFNFTRLENYMGENFEAIPTPWGQNWESRPPPPLPTGRKTVRLPPEMAPKFSENLQPIRVPRKTSTNNNSNIEEEANDESLMPNIELEEGEVRPKKLIPKGYKPGYRAGNNRSRMSAVQPQKGIAQLLQNIRTAPPLGPKPRAFKPVWQPPPPVNIKRLISEGKFYQTGTTANGKPILKLSNKVPVSLRVNNNGRVRVNIKQPWMPAKRPAPPRNVPTEANFQNMMARINALTGKLKRNEAKPRAAAPPPPVPVSNKPFPYKMNTKNYKAGPEPRIELEGKMIRCTALDRDILESIALEMGIDPKAYKTKMSLSQALKILHNRK